MECGGETRYRRHALRAGRTAVAIATACALLYPLARLPWVFGVPLGIDVERNAAPEVIHTGIALGVAALVGVVVMSGIVHDRGVRVLAGSESSAAGGFPCRWRSYPR